MAKQTVRCGCADHGCKAHPGVDCALRGPRSMFERLHRVDMDDAEGTLFCPACTDDAFAAGVFRSEHDVIEDDTTEEKGS